MTDNRELWMGPFGGVLENVHSRLDCEGQACVLHNPTDHHMRDWPTHWRDDKHMMERICPHNVGHPDPDDAAYQRLAGRGYLLTHGCDGCCWYRPEEGTR